MWRLLQSVFDADREGLSLNGLGTRMSQLFSGFSYAALAVAAFSLLAGAPEDPAGDGVMKSREHAAAILALPFGQWLLVGGGAAGAGSRTVVIRGRIAEGDPRQARRQLLHRSHTFVGLDANTGGTGAG